MGQVVAVAELCYAQPKSNTKEIEIGKGGCNFIWLVRPDLSETHKCFPQTAIKIVSIEMYCIK